MGTLGAYVFDRNRFDDLATSLAADYQKAEPFPHVVIDDFVPDADLLDTIVSEFPEASSRVWLRYEHDRSRKRALNDVTAMGEATLRLLLQCNAEPFVGFLEKVTGIDGLIPDPGLVGGGMHQISRGGFLDAHADFNRHQHMQLDRRINVLIYLNRDWKAEYRGQFELWDREGHGPVKTVEPIFNRCVIFSTTEDSFHGHPAPLECPPGTYRRSLALYYYTNGRPDGERTDAHLTIYPLRPRRRAVARDGVLRFVPPIVVDVAAAARDRLRNRR